MLSPEERREIEAELPHYPRKQALSIDAMKIVQKHRGRLSDEALEDIAEFLGMSASDLDGVATFYNLLFRKPVGRHVIYVCDSVSCWIMGAKHVTRQLTMQCGLKPSSKAPSNC
ncbi:MAG: NAD(P)H-dependent oxidoreductase subunit E [Bryobacteraceae bacterium]